MLAELFRRANDMIGDQLEEDVLLQLFNECNEDLGQIAGYAVTSETTFAKGDSELALPDGLVDLIELKIKIDGKEQRVIPLNLRNDGDEYEDETIDHYGYERFGEGITLRPAAKGDGSLLIRFYSELPVFADINATPVLPKRFWRLYPMFAASRYKAEFLEMYMMAKAELEADTLRKKRKTRPNQIRLTRGWY